MKTVSHKYKHISIEERGKIEILYKLDYSKSKIARILKRSKSTISREIARCKFVRGYQSNVAQTRANKAKARSHRHNKISYYPLLNFIERMLKKRWSPEIIAAVWSKEHPDCTITHTTIYTFIKKHRQNWNKYLIYKHKRRGKLSHKARVNMIPNRIDIAQRPKEVLLRNRIGDIEADTVISAHGGKSCLAVFVDRKTRLLKIVKMKDKSSWEMVRAATRALNGIPVKTITYDNGMENVKHEEINAVFGCQSFFCKPYCSADKGSIENRNKIIRQFFPKKTNFDLITQADIDNVEFLINSRPLKCLNWSSPFQVFDASRSA